MGSGGGQEGVRRGSAGGIMAIVCTVPIGVRMSSFEPFSRRGGRSYDYNVFLVSHSAKRLA
eukprot:7752578-Pyramimonas_sp.AAC.1